MAELEATLTATVDGEEVPFRMLRPRLMNEENRDARARLEAARNELNEEHLNALELQAAQVVQRETRRLGATTTPTCTGASASRSTSSRSSAAACSPRRKASGWRQATGSSARASGSVSTTRSGGTWAARGAAPAGTPRSRPTECCRHSRAPSPISASTSAHRRTSSSTSRPPEQGPAGVLPPIEIPGRVVLVIKPQGGPDDWRAFFHEAGHTEHFANTSPSLAMEEKRLGDNAVTEAWAMLLEP